MVTVKRGGRFCEGKALFHERSEKEERSVKEKEVAGTMHMNDKEGVKGREAAVSSLRLT